MHSRMLIAHDSRAVRSILRRRTLAEAPEFQIDEVESDEEAIQALVDCSYDLVICDETFVGQPGNTWKGVLASRGCAKPLEFIYLVSESTTESRKQALAASGPCAFIDAACSSADIASAIGHVYDPRHSRVHRRVSVPGAKSIIRVGAANMQADMVNFSEAGMLCEFPTPANFGSILHATEVSLVFTTPQGRLDIDGIRARILRIYVVDRNVEHWPDRLRAAWQFVNVPPDSFQRLRTVVEDAEADEEPAPISSFVRP